MEPRLGNSGPLPAKALRFLQLFTTVAVAACLQRCRFGYGVGMASPVAPISASPLGATPSEIRAALIGEEIGDFDREYRTVLAETAETMDLSGLQEMLKRWQRVALTTQRDPHAHRQMLEHANHLIMGGDIATEPWQETKAKLGL